MKYHDSYPEAESKSKEAMDFLGEHNLAYNPVHYAVAYQHISDTNPKLSITLNEILEKSSPDPYEMEILFDNYITENKPNSDKSIENLTNCIEQLEDINGESGTAVNQLDESIESQQKKDSPALQNIIKAARAVRIAQEKVNKQLAEAREQSNALKQELQDAQEQAVTDSLTSLKNRTGMKNYLAEMEAPEFKDFSIAIADIDHFKKFNDDFGHLVGDLILKRLGRLLKEELPIPCEGFRFGGEEFVILMPQCNKERAMDIAESLRVGVSKLRFKSAKTKERLPKMTISLGVTGWQPDDELENVLMRADQALYEAKNSGRNKVRHS